MRTVIVVLAIAAIALLVVTETATAVVPQTINYQGVLKDNLRKPVPGLHSMIFRLYNDSSGGAQVWEETQTVSVDSAGLFNVILGTVTSVPDSAFRAQTWLGTSVGADPEMTPRTRLTSVGYAYRVNSMDGAKGGTVYGDLSLTQGSKLRFLSSGAEPYFKDVNGVRYTSDLLHPFQIENAGLMVGYTSSGGGISAGDLLVSGNVGIGTTTPAKALHVVGEGIVLDRGGSDVALFGASDNIEHNHYLNLVNATGRLSAWGLRAGGLLVADNFGYGSPGKNDLVVKGNVGIGTPTPLYRLHTEGSSFSTDQYTGGVAVGNGSSYTLNKGDEFRFETSYGYASGPVKIAVRGNFANDALDTQDALSLSFSRQEGVDYDYGYPYMFDINQFGVTKFRLDKFGNVGIGTTTPADKLHVIGNLCVTGQKNAIVPTSQGMTKVYSEESAELWFTDYGKAHLSDGRCHINLDRLFLETVTIDDDHPMMIFLQEEDECNGLIVRTGHNGFDVIEKAGGGSDAQFSYRVVAKRKGYEGSRLEAVQSVSVGGGR